MARKSKNTSSKTTSTVDVASVAPVEKSIVRKFGEFLLKCFYLAFWFDLSICLNFVTCFPMLLFRGAFWAILALNWHAFDVYFTPSEETFKDLMFEIFVFAPVMIFILWYLVTSFFMFYCGLRSFGGLVTVVDNDNVVGGDYSEINKFIDWRNNKMRFMSYEDSAKMMADTGVLNNLNTQDPEARRTLDYINNKMRFKSYPDALKMLRGEK